MDPVRVAFCPLLFASHGGQFDSLGRPIFAPADQDERTARGNCDAAYDCGRCPLLTQWVNARVAEGWEVGWECQDCLKKEVPVGKKPDYLNRMVPGFYQSSRYRGDPEHWEDVEPENPLEGCTACGFGTPVLQLVLRRRQ